MLGANAKPGGRGGLLGVAQLHEGPEALSLLACGGGVGLGQQRLAAVDIARGKRWYGGQDCLEPRVEPGVGCDVVRHR